MDVDDGEMQTLTVLSIRQSLGNVYFCDGSQFGSDCSQVAVTTGVCANVPSDFSKKISSFRPPQNVACTLYEYVNSPTATERQII